MKALGLVLVFISFFSVGLFFSKRQIFVLKSIKRAEDFLNSILLNLKNEHLTVYELIEKIRRDSDFETKKHLESVTPENLLNFGKSAYSCGFIKNKTAASVFYEAISVLGKYGIDEQTDEIEFCRNKLRSLYEKSEENYKSKARLYAYFGFFGGILAAIFLI